MARALELAARGRYTAHPNPRVGCVLVSANKVVGEGWHRRAGGPHAEIAALDSAGAKAAGATAYLHAFARVLGAHYHLQAAIAEGGAGPRTALAQYYITRLLPEYEAALEEARAGSAGVFSLSLEAMAR